MTEHPLQLMRKRMQHICRVVMQHEDMVGCIRGLKPLPKRIWAKWLAESYDVTCGGGRKAK
jgi:hypothetical protein